MMRNIAEQGRDGAHDAGETMRQSAAIFNGRNEALRHGTEAPAVASALAATAQKRRRVCDAGGSTHLPGKVVLDEVKRESADEQAREAYQGLGDSYDLYSQVYHRNSLDGAGIRLDATVHYGQRFGNAMWDGTRIIFGDGDGKLFLSFTKTVDVIGHEFAHGVTQFMAGLGYSGQTGALNEHISDAFGIMVKQRKLRQTAGESDWLIGAGLFGPTVNGKGVRSMKAPGTAYDDPILGKDPQPNHMRNYVETERDHGGVHLNSGIPNYAFYLTATIIGGYTWETAGWIWFQALMGLPPNAEFDDFARATVETAGELYGTGSDAQSAVEFAWKRVGLPVNVPTRLVQEPRILPVQEPAVAPAAVPAPAPLPALSPAGAARPGKWSTSVRK